MVAFTIAHFGYNLVKFHWTTPPIHLVATYTKALMIRQGANPYDRAALAPALDRFHPGMGATKKRSSYPPAYYALFIPLTFLPIHLAGLLWRLVLLTALGTTGYLVMRSLRAEWSWEWLALTCLVFLSNTYFLPLLERGHNQFLLLCMLAAVWWAHHQDRPWLAGVLLGMSVIFKPMPLILLPLFLIKRQYRTVVAALATLLGLSIGSVLLVGGSTVGQWLFGVKGFHAHVLFHKYQLSTISLAHKLLGGSHPAVAYGVGAGTLVALYIISLVVCARGGNRPLRVGEYALVVTLIPISSPYVFPHLLTLLALPLLVAAHLLMDREPFPARRWGVFVVLWLTWALGFYYFRWQPEGVQGLRSLLGYVPLFSAIGLWGFLLYGLRLPSAERAVEEPPSDALVDAIASAHPDHDPLEVPSASTASSARTLR